MIYNISQVLDGERLDKALALLTNANREKIIQKIFSGSIEVNEKVVLTKSYRLKTGDHVSVDLDLFVDEYKLEPDSNITFKVIYEDEFLAVIDKPTNLVVHPSSLDSKKDLATTLVSQLLYKYPKIANVGESFRPGIVHRLDKDTTGLMVIALETESYNKLKSAVKSHKISRKYLAIVVGAFKDKFGKIEAPVGRSLTNKVKMAVVENGKSAVTHFKVLETFSSSSPCSLVEVNLETGRTHQIRVHFAELGHPVLADKLYSSKVKIPEVSALRPMLHATELSFLHPISNKLITASSSLPEDFNMVLNQLRSV